MRHSCTYLCFLDQGTPGTAQGENEVIEECTLEVGDTKGVKLLGKLSEFRIHIVSRLYHAIFYLASLYDHHKSSGVNL